MVRKSLRLMLPIEVRAKLKKALVVVRCRLISGFSAFPSAASLFYFLFSKEFRNENQAVLSGRVAYEESVRNIRKSNALLRRNIHRIEKALIMRPRRPIFAKNYIAQTVDIYLRALETSGFCTQELEWASEVLDAYFSTVVQDAEIKKVYERFLGNQRASNGQKKTPYAYRMLEPTAIKSDELYALFRRRSSVRWYCDRPVPLAKIQEAVTMASTAPSACNRQPYHFYATVDPVKASALARCAGGTVGFAENLQCILAVVGDLSCYPKEKDRHVIYIDGSLAAMQLMLALETLGLASCPINWPEVEAREKLLREIIELKRHERVVMLIAVGYPDPAGGIPFSQKKGSDLLLKEM